MNSPASIATIITLAIYTPGTVRCSQDHEDYVYEAVNNLDFDEGQKAELYARLAEVLTPTMPFREAEYAIEQAIIKVRTYG